MKSYSNDAILEGLRLDDNEVLNFIYKKYFPAIKFLVIGNSGNTDDANDIFQDALVIIYRKVKDDNLVLSCAFGTYLYSVCNVFLKRQLEEKKKSVEVFVEDEVMQNVADDVSEDVEKSEQYGLYQKHFLRLPEDCRKVLQMAIEKVPLREVAVVMGYKSEMYAKRRKYLCKEALIRNIKSDPNYNEI